MNLAEVQNIDAQERTPGGLSRAISKEDGNIDPFGLYPDLSPMHKAGALATALGFEEAAEAMLSNTHLAQVATQQALGANFHLLRRTVQIVAPALLALCLLGIWLSLQ
jgi:hypothetical protein